MRLPRALLRLIRWENALIAAAGVLIGAWWVGGYPLSTPTLLIAGAAIALAAVANAYNDVCDVEIDRLAHPDRPLPKGDLSLGAAQTTVRVAAVIAIVLGAAAGPMIGISFVLVIAIMLLYSRSLKRSGLPGNLTVAILASLPFLYGGWSVGRPLAALTLMALAIPLHLAREIAKDIDDAAADAAVRRTLPITADPRVTHAVLLGSVAGFFGALSVFASARPVFAAALIPAVVLAVVATHRAIRGMRGAPLIFKSAMLCAMASLLLMREG